MRNKPTQKYKVQAHQLKQEYEYSATQAIFGSDHNSDYTQTMYNFYGSKIVLLGNDRYTDSQGMYGF